MLTIRFSLAFLAVAMACPAAAAGGVPVFNFWDFPGNQSGQPHANLLGGKNAPMAGYSVSCKDLAKDADGNYASTYKYAIRIQDPSAPEDDALNASIASQSGRVGAGGGFCASKSNVFYNFGDLSITEANTGAKETPVVILVGSVSPDTYGYVMNKNSVLYGTKLFIHGINQYSGAVLWQKGVLETDNDFYTVDTAQSGLADFLNSDGIDEVRVVRYKVNADRSVAYKFDFYNVLNGATILSKTFTVPAP
jgi:hypothetical protein